MRPILLASLLILSAVCTSLGQKRDLRNIEKRDFSTQILEGGRVSIHYASERSNPMYIPAPRKFRSGSERTKTSEIIVTYIGFEAQTQARDAFQFAVDIWEDFLISDVPINVTAVWANDLEQGVLGSAVTGNLILNPADDLTPKLNLIYPIALAEKLAREPLNDSDEIDILAQFNSTRDDWHFDTSTPAPDDKYDFATVVLHELAHGLGFSGAVQENGATAQIGVEGFPFAFTSNYEVKPSNDNLVYDVQNSSIAMLEAITGDDLFFVTEFFQGSNEVEMHAPSTFRQGQSVFHLHEKYTDLQGGANALMTPFIDEGETIHDPGFAVDMLKDLGWSFSWLEHEPAISNENLDQSTDLTVEIVTEEGIFPDSVFINYEFLNLLNTDQTGSARIKMVPTGNPNEFIGTIPATGFETRFVYHIEAWDSTGRKFTNPGQPEFFNNLGGYAYFSIEDEFTPNIDHVPVTYVTEDENTIDILAIANDVTTGIDSIYLEYSIDGVVQESKNLDLINETFSVYATDIDISELDAGSVITYRLAAVDQAIANNFTTSPGAGNYSFTILPEAPTAVEEYLNDFNAAESSEDFVSSSFVVSTPPGFSNGNLHTPNPYELGFDNLYNVVVLTQPIKVKSGTDSFLSFDEVVLVEPGDNDGLWDFVVVEASNDGGETWIELVDPYDSREESDWNAAWSNANRDENGNSTEVGNSTLFRERTINLQGPDDISSGDEVLIRFVLYSDQLFTGWGWAIDNLNIQAGVTGIEELLAENGISIYPNPSTDVFNIEMQLQKPVREAIFTVTDIMGRTVETIKTYESGATIQQSVDLSGKPFGLYTITIMLDGESTTRRIIKQ